MEINELFFLVGFPNAGKTTLFNLLTGLNFKTVNYPGSTVDFTQGKLSTTQMIIDTPGITDVNASSLDERITLDLLQNFRNLLHLPDHAKAYAILVLDATQLDHHLKLVKQFKDHKIPIAAVVLTMVDLLDNKGQFSPNILQNELGVPVIPVTGRSQSNCHFIKQNLAIINPENSVRIVSIQNQTQSEIASSLKWARDMATRIGGKKRVQKFDFDSLVFHPIWGGVLFCLIMVLFFYSIFSLAAPLMDGIDSAISGLAAWLEPKFSPGLISELIFQGIFPGIGSVAVFLPQIAILFLGLGLLEGSGYLARAAVIVDKPLSKIGLNGRSFLPLMSGCACAIPAMMAARNIPGPKQRFLSLFIIPLMQCSARLPVYGLLLSLLFLDSPLKSGIVLAGIYLGGISIAFIVAGIGAKILGVSEGQDQFQIHLPHYHFPDIPQILKHTYAQTKSFIYRAGPTIFWLSIAIWALSTFPSPDHSWIMMVGQKLAFIFKPLGVDWRVGAALLLAFVAREVFVSALVVLYAIKESAGVATILPVLQNATFDGTSDLVFTVPTILGLLVFFMISMQCVSTLAVARKEFNSWKIALLQMLLYVILGYISAVLVRGGALLF